MEDLKETPKEEQTNPTKADKRDSRGEVGAHNAKGLFHSFKRREGRKAKHISMKAWASAMVEENNELGIKATEEEQAIVLQWFKSKAEHKRNRW